MLITKMQILLKDSGLNRMQKIQLLAELMNQEVNKSLDEKLPEYIVPLLKAENFPVDAQYFKEQLGELAPPLESKESAHRRTLRHVALLHDKGIIESKGKGSFTTYYLTCTGEQS